MTFLSRDIFTAKLVKAFGLKSFTTDLSPTLVPGVQVLDLEQSAWPPYIPFYGYWTRAALAANVSTCMIAAGGDAIGTGLPKFSRVVIDSAEILSAENSGSVRTFIGTFADLGGAQNLSAFVRRTDVQDDAADSTGAGSPTIPELGMYTLAVAVANADQFMQIPITANVAKVIQPKYPIAVLRPGQMWGVQNTTVNLVLNLAVRGRFFLGQ